MQIEIGQVKEELKQELVIHSYPVEYIEYLSNMVSF